MKHALWLLPLLALGCAPVHLPEPSDAMLALARQRDPNATLDGLSSGRQLTADRCGECHRPPKPAETSSKKWPKTFEKMVGKAELSPEQAAAVEAYLRASAGLQEERG